MDEVVLDATLKKDTSKKGNVYYYIEIKITNNVSKRFFLEPSDLELIRLTYGLD